MQKHKQKSEEELISKIKFLEQKLNKQESEHQLAVDKIEARYHESEQTLINIINFLPDATFVIDNKGTVIAWNQAIEEMTGIKAKDMLGKNNYEYSLPFYGYRRPILIDLVLERNPGIQDNYLFVNNAKGRLSGESFCPLIGKSGAFLFGTTSPLCNSCGETVGAIESIRDISTRKQMENALRNSEEQFRKLADTSPAMICLLQGYRYVYINSYFTALSGYSDTELKNIYSLNLVHHDFRDEMKNKMRALLKGEEVPSRFETVSCSKDGQEHWIDYSANPIEYNNKPAIIVAAYDISERKKMETALRNSEENFRRLSDTAPALIYVLRGSRLIYVNAAFETITGYSRKECLEMEAWDFIHPEYRQWVSKVAVARQEGDHSVPFRYETKLLRKDRQEIWADFSVGMIDFEGAPAVIGVAYDISDRKKAESALHESEQKFSDIISFLPDPTMVIDSDGVVIAWNYAMQKMTGIRPQEMIGKGNYEYAIPFYGKRKPVLINHVLNPGDYTTDEYPIFKKSFGEVLSVEKFCPSLGNSGIYVYAIASPLYDISGKKVGAIESIRDITESKKAEEEIKWLSFHDKLTGLYNRAYFESALEELDNEKHLPISMIIGDVNGLKIVNDAFGHQEGDRLLKIVAKLMHASCRSHDILARWGGDEFVVLLPSTDEKDSIKICEEIRNNCKNHISDFPVEISIALGTACKNRPEQRMSDISKEAEDRMYRSKLLGSKSARSAFINSLEKTLWTRSHETQAHTSRMRALIVDFGKALKLSDSHLDNLTLLSTLHDIGKIAIPNSILDKPGKLSQEEWEFMKKHSEIGYRIAMSSPELAAISEAVLTHHERWDGNGYPMGLKQDAIPLHARMLSLVDSYDVMLHGRPYQKKRSKEEALNEILACAGTQFDPELAPIFVDLMLKHDSPAKTPKNLLD